MKRYRVRFLKTVCNDRGDERSICQRALEVDSAGEEAAVELAKRLFCSREQVSDWSLRSDSYEVEGPESSLPTDRMPKPQRAAA
jgi:hypothetical protein